MSKRRGSKVSAETVDGEELMPEHMESMLFNEWVRAWIKQCIYSATFPCLHRPPNTPWYLGARQRTRFPSLFHTSRDGIFYVNCYTLWAAPHTFTYRFWDSFTMTPWIELRFVLKSVFEVVQMLRGILFFSHTWLLNGHLSLLLSSHLKHTLLSS